ncbi:hypothetical protein HAX54_000592, partial [Datura stramonium]|nr:hypothetical protein [Datura stramonium]
LEAATLAQGQARRSNSTRALPGTRHYLPKTMPGTRHPSSGATADASALPCSALSWQCGKLVKRPSKVQSHFN